MQWDKRRHHRFYSEWKVFAEKQEFFQRTGWERVKSGEFILTLEWTMSSSKLSKSQKISCGLELTWIHMEMVVEQIQSVFKVEAMRVRVFPWSAFHDVVLTEFHVNSLEAAIAVCLRWNVTIGNGYRVTMQCGRHGTTNSGIDYTLLLHIGSVALHSCVYLYINDYHFVCASKLKQKKHGDFDDSKQSETKQPAVTRVECNHTYRRFLFRFHLIVLVSLFVQIDKEIKSNSFLEFPIVFVPFVFLSLYTFRRLSRPVFFVFCRKFIALFKQQQQKNVQAFFSQSGEFRNCRWSSCIAVFGVCNFLTVCSWFYSLLHLN